MKDRILAYMGDGLTAAQTATIVGCSPAYISQLLKDENFRAEVEARVLSNRKPADEVLDTKYESLEHTIVKEMGAAVVGAELPHLTRALEAVTKARDMKEKRKHPLNNTNIRPVTVVSISIPQHALAAPTISVSDKGEVLAIDNQVLAPMTSRGVEQLFNSIRENKKDPKGLQNGNSNVTEIEFEAYTPTETQARATG